MAMKTILVPVEDSSVLPSILTTALLAAQRFGSHIEAMHVRPELGGVVATDGMGGALLMESFERDDADRARKAHALFDDFVRAHDVVRGAASVAQTAPSAAWHDNATPGDDFVGLYGRVFDLTVVGRPVRGQMTPRMTTLESALFESGRPILIAPPTVPVALGDKIVIAWNGSTETVRTIALTMPFLAQASKVVVLTIEGGSVTGPEGTEIARSLTLNGIPAEASTRPASGRAIGAAILEEAASLGADLLVKGAYTQSRLRQMVFGGATSHILAETELPVLMAH
ncbi:MAG: universal stress protein [Inquilinaceae bacterium]